MKLHELKIKHEYLEAVVCGKKTFELRKNDRDYQVGDLIHFIDEGTIIPLNNNFFCEERIDDDALYKITYILKDVPQYGLNVDYCILGIKKVEIKEV